MSDPCIILDSINTLNPATSIVNYARAQFLNTINRFGGNYTKLHVIKTLNDLGSIIDISSEYSSIKVFFFDRFKSNNLVLSGISSNTDKFESVRAYVYYNCEINSGDFLLVNFNSTDKSYTEKYRILEKETHEVGGEVIFNTLYLVREVM